MEQQHLRFHYYYIILSGLLVSIYLVFFWQQRWIWDFWTHAAIIRELSVRPFSPGNPFLASAGVGILYWPYGVTLAMFSKLSGLDAHHILALMGAVNLLLLLCVFYRFSLAFCRDSRSPFWGLIIVLFLWGGDPWGYSAFYHSEVIFYSLPYPSTFAFVLALHAITMLFAGGISHSNHKILYLALIAIFIILIHPITYLFFAATCGSVILFQDRRVPYRVSALVMFSVLTPSLLIAVVWPFMPLSELLFSNTLVGDPSAQYVYQGVFYRTYPVVILGLPFVVFRLRNNLRVIFPRIGGHIFSE